MIHTLRINADSFTMEIKQSYKKLTGKTQNQEKQYTIRSFQRKFVILQALK